MFKISTFFSKNENNRIIVPEFLPKINARNSGIYNVLRGDFVIYYRIRALREDKDWTQQYVADQLGVNRRTYSAYENGVNTMSPEILAALAKLHNTSVDYLLELSDSP